MATDEQIQAHREALAREIRRLNRPHNRALYELQIVGDWLRDREYTRTSCLAYLLTFGRFQPWESRKRLTEQRDWLLGEYERLRERLDRPQKESP